MFACLVLLTHFNVSKETELKIESKGEKRKETQIHSEERVFGDRKVTRENERT